MRAYALIEILVTIGLITSGLVTAAVVGIDSLERAQSVYDLERMLSLLRRVPPHQNVRIDSVRAVLFEGNAFTPASVRAEIRFSGKTSIQPTTILFAPGSGASSGAVIPITAAHGAKYRVTISEAGVLDVTKL
jgi:hypothetical protein